MKIVRPRHTGFCFGVRDALAMTETVLDEGADLVALGQVVHNARALVHLEQKGLRQATELPPAETTGAVITAHGATPELLREAEERGVRVVDTTCPLVRRVQQHALDFRQQGVPVVVVGHAAHAEVIGVVGWAGAAQGAVVEVVASVDEADQLPFRARRGVICQSTFPQQRFREVVEHIQARGGEVEVRDTTCPVVNQRQREAVTRMLDDVDVVVVVGGQGSANTVALAEACADRRPTHHIESASELKKEWFSPGQAVGLTSGTSTPGWVVDEVEVACRAL